MAVTTIIRLTFIYGDSGVRFCDNIYYFRGRSTLCLANNLDEYVSCLAFGLDISTETPTSGICLILLNLGTEPASSTSSLRDRSFAAAGPRAWNKLPPLLRHVYSAATFKRQLKTFLYNHAFN